MSDLPMSPDPSRALVFIVHGLGGNAHSIGALRQLAQQCFPNGTVKAPDFPHKRIWSMRRAADTVVAIMDRIDALWDAGDYDKLILIGHSMGAVMVRRAAMEAYGERTHRKGPQGKEEFAIVEPAFAPLKRRIWADKVDKVILIASIGRGWSIETTKNPTQRAQWAFGAMIGHLLPKIWRPTVFDFRRGSLFIVQTRLRWLDFCAAHPDDRPRVVQVLGTSDELVPPDDSVDFATTGEGAKFMQIEIPHSGHKDILDVRAKRWEDAALQRHATVRGAIMGAILTDTPAGYRDHIVRREHLSDALPQPPNRDVKNLIFVMHGIRDRGFWTKKIAARVKEKAEMRQTPFASRTPSYGYFPILPFLLKWYRRQKVEWLMDHYVEAKAEYPEAKMHFMGHSNGTYLGAKALQLYPMVRFERMMFAGSVVRTDYPWRQMVAQDRVGQIFNIVADADWVVAVFPNGLRWFQKIFDLGGAGHNGFDTRDAPDALYQMDMPAGSMSRFEYVDGNHSAARKEELWDELADFFVDGTTIEAGAHDAFVRRQSTFMQVLGDFAPWLVLAIAGFIISFGAVAFAFPLAELSGMTAPEWIPDWHFLQVWGCYTLSTKLLILLGYIVTIRFLAVRL